MAETQGELFGGPWTEKKLGVLGAYLAAYAKVMKNQSFVRLYVDAFAGTGYRETGSAEGDSGLFPCELAQDEPQQFLDGSARIALGVQPVFDRYVFVEKSAKQFAKLVKLREDFPELADRIDCIQGDANHVLQDLCDQWNSRTMRGVLFLDPYGMQVDWTTLEPVARTRAIDVWILFPLGIGVNRLLPRHGQVPDGWRTRLDRVFGTTEWYGAFYRPAGTRGLFDARPHLQKTGSLNAIAEYYQERLRTIFPAVAENPKVLSNSRGTPLYLLCFAAGNPSPKAKDAALRIAQHILG